MSAEVTCQECEFANPAGAKFCSNCGAKLPVGTKIVCVNCNTINPGDRVFCDQCGVRLQTAPYDRQSREEEDKQQGSTQAFSLPARPPGQTGELDPNMLPEWLRTGETQPISEEEAMDTDEQEESSPQPPLETPDTGDLPKIEELTPEKRMTDDLPDWLVDDADSKPIIASPDEISTEMYLDLIRRADESLDLEDDFADEGAAVDLPDWLAAADQLGDQLPAPDAERPLADDDGDEAVPDEIPDWLASLAEPEADAGAAGVSTDDSDEASGLTDWLTAVDDSSAAELGEEDSEQFSDLTEQLGDAEPAPESDTDGADWLSASDPGSESSGSEAGLTDWLSELHDLADATEAPEAEEDWFAQMASDAAAEEPVDALSDWLELDESDDTTQPDADASPPLPSEGGIADEISRTLAAEDVDNVATDFTDLFEVSAESADLPDWLADVVAEGESFVAEEEDKADVDAVDDLFSREEVAAQSELDWLMQTGSLSLPASDAPQEPQAEESASAEGDTGELDWLSDLAALDTGSLQTKEVEPDDDVAAEAEPPAPADAGPPPLAAEEAETSLESAPFNTDDFLASESPVQDDLPEWLGELDSQPVAAEAEEADEAVPSWLAADDEDDNISFSSVLSEGEEEEADPLAGLPKELVGAELPEWLQDAEEATPTLPPAAPAAEEDEEIPDWLSEAPALEDESLPEPIQSEWGALLDELPPPDTREGMTQELPEWIQELRPDGLEDESVSFFEDEALAESEEEAPAETHGPLAGIAGIIPVAPAVTLSHSIMPVATLVATPEERKQAALLQQLLHAPASPRRAVTPANTAVSDNVWLRLLFALLLLLAIGLGLAFPLSQINPVPALNSAAAAATEIDAAAGQPVLVAFEFTPAFAGELSPQATAVLARLAQNESPILTLSQHTAGTALATAALDDYTGADLGYLPGGAIGLRQLSDCLKNGSPACNSLLLNAPADYLENIGLIIVFTSERDSLLGWIEQVGSQTSIPIVVGTPASLAPMAAPYLDSGQLTSVIDGAAGTAAFLGEMNMTDDAPLRRQITAQTAAQLMAALLLLIGLVVGLVRPSPQQENNAS